MKKIFLSLISIAIILCTLTACDSGAVNKKVSSLEFKYDVNQVNIEGEDENESELMAARIYKEINEDSSLDRTIGTVEGKEITAKEMELRALKMKRKGSDAPYRDAWNDFLLNGEVEKLAAQYQIHVDSEVREHIEWTRNEFMEGESTGSSEAAIAKNYIVSLISTLGLTEDEYWNGYLFESMRNAILKSRVQEYIRSEGKASTDIPLADGKITDEEYIKKVGNE